MRILSEVFTDLPSALANYCAAQQPSRRNKSLQIDGGGHSLNTWHYRLTADPETGLPIGHERTPGNRYGRDANSAAWWAIAAHTAYSYATGQAWSDTETRESLDYFRGLAVNDHESVYELVRDFKDMLPEELVFLLSGDMVDLRSY